MPAPALRHSIQTRVIALDLRAATCHRAQSASVRMSATIALAAGLASRGALEITAAGASAACTPAALVGMGIGHMILFLLGGEPLARSIL
jgi:hypothetical protein